MTVSTCTLVHERQNCIPMGYTRSSGTCSGFRNAPASGKSPKSMNVARSAPLQRRQAVNVLNSPTVPVLLGAFIVSPSHGISAKRRAARAQQGVLEVLKKDLRAIHETRSALVCTTTRQHIWHLGVV